MSGPNECVAMTPERTTKGIHDETYERLLGAHATIESSVACLYGEDSESVSQPVGVGIHASATENERLASLLQGRLDRLYNRL